MRRARLATGLTVLGVALGAAACSDSKKKIERLERDGDAAAVIVVDRPTEAGNIIDEAEPNDESPQAVDADGVRGSLATAEDEDVYRFRAETDGWVETRVGGIEGVDLVLELRDSEGVRLAVSDRGPDETSEGVVGYPVTGGTDYRVAIREFVSKRRKKKAQREGASPPYVVRWRRIEAAAGREVEPNRDAEGAAELALGEERSGYYGWNGDVDVWKLSLKDLARTEEGRPEEVVDLTLAGVEGVTPKLSVAEPSGEVLAQRSGARGGGIVLRGLAVDDEDSAMLVKLESKRTHPDTAYTLRAVVRPLGDGDEVEPNDKPQRAAMLPAPVAGSLERASGSIGAGDVDHWRLPAASEARTLEVSASAPAGINVVLEVANDGGAILGRADAGEAGAAEKLSGIAVPANAEVVVVIRSKEQGGDAQRYELSYSTVRGLPAIDPLTPDLVDLVE